MLSHLAASGKAFHEKAGPHIPIPGPTFAKLEITTLYASSKFRPMHIIVNQPAKTNSTNTVKNASTVLLVVEATLNPFTRTGKTAFG